MSCIECIYLTISVLNDKNVKEFIYLSLTENNVYNLGVMTMTIVCGKRVYRVLVVDDIKENFDTLKMFFGQFSEYELEFDQSGQTLAEVISGEQDFDLILLDLMFPGDDEFGFKMVKFLRQADNFTPVIMISASENKAEEVLNSGVDIFHEKPFQFRLLLAQVKALLRRVEWSTRSLVE